MSGHTRENIVRAADELFYQQGFAYTSFAHIAEQVQISRGNFYHHFKTKDKLLDAVITYRLTNTQLMLKAWEQESASCKQRILCFIRILNTNQSKIAAYGCPVGTLSTELAKLDHGLQYRAAEVFELFRHWLCRQFEFSGCGHKADKYALHVLAWSQGAATLFNAFKDQEFLMHELGQIESWLNRVL